MSDFPAMEYRPSDEGQIELGPGETSLSFLQRVYRSVTQPMSRRMQAAMAALPHEHPKLGAVATVNMSGETYAAMLDRAIERSRAASPTSKLSPTTPLRPSPSPAPKARGPALRPGIHKPVASPGMGPELLLGLALLMDT